MIGIITFHASHNYGSVLQAYATQQLVKKLGFESEIINFRMKSQKEYYSLYQTKFGVRLFLGDLLMLPCHKLRKQRYNKFENFITNDLTLSKEELHNYNDLKKVSSFYDVYLSGSDQIWSNRIAEFVASDTDYTGVYFLDFASNSKKRIAFASSIGEASEQDLSNKVDLLKKYNSLALRENYGVEIVSKLSGKTAVKVLDPTLMLAKEEWLKLITKKPLIEGNYIFLYTLRGLRSGLKWGKYLVELSRKLNMKIICVSPFFPIMAPGVKNLFDVGPKDFLNLIHNASLVFTDSFHGTAFSINLNKPFFSLTPSIEKDVRKREIIDTLGLSDRIITQYEQIASIENWQLDYSSRIANKKLSQLRHFGMDYLYKAISI